MPTTKHEFLLWSLEDEDMRVADVEISDLLERLSNLEEYIAISKETTKIFYKNNDENIDSIDFENYKKLKNQFTQVVEKYVIKGTFSNTSFNKEAEDGEFTITFENFEEEDEKIKDKMNKYVNCIIDFNAPFFTLGVLDDLTMYLTGIYKK